MSTSAPQIVDFPGQPVLEVRSIVAMSELPAFYQDAYATLGEFVQQHGIAVIAPPLGITRGMPSDTIDIAAAFPVAELPSLDDWGGVVGTILPAGRAASLTLTGSYEELPSAYETLLAWMSQNGHEPGGLAWEQYLTMPDEHGDTDPGATVTQLYWLLA